MLPIGRNDWDMWLDISGLVYFFDYVDYLLINFSGRIISNILERIDIMNDYLMVGDNSYMI